MREVTRTLLCCPFLPFFLLNSTEVRRLTPAEEGDEMPGVEAGVVLPRRVGGGEDGGPRRDGPGEAGPPPPSIPSRSFFSGDRGDLGDRGASASKLRGKSHQEGMKHKTELQQDFR